MNASLARYTAPLAALSLCAITACGLFASSAPRSTASTPDAVGLRWRALRTHAPGDGGIAADAAVARNVDIRCPSGAVFVAGGTFVMGSPDGEGAPDEHPSHQVTLRAYCVDRIEVTVGAYTQCVTAGACTRTAAALPQDNAPVTGIDWEQAVSFCRFAGGRLPTEAEWEYAARGNDGRRFPWGETPPSDCARADWTPPGSGQSCAGVGPSPAALREGGASPSGALDMVGNVWEWTADWYAPRYTAGVARNPTGPAEGSARVTRGGGWNNDQIERMRVTWREGQHPAFRDFDLGVRCAYDAAP